MKKLFFILFVTKSVLIYSQTYICTTVNSECGKLLWKGYLTEHVDKEFAKALSIYKAAIQKDSTCCDAYNFLAKAYSSIGDFDKSIKIYFKSLSVDSNNYIAYLSLGHIYLHIGLKKESIELFKKGLIIKPNNLEVLHGLSEAYLADSSYKDAYQTIFNAILILNNNPELEENNIVIYKTAGIIYYVNGAKKSAIDYMLKAYVYLNKDSELNYYIAKYYADNNRKEAKSYFKKALKFGYKIDEETLVKYELK